MASTTINVTLPEAAALFKRLGARTPSILMKAAEIAALEIRPIMVRQTDTAPPASPRGSRGAVNTGDYRRRWSATRPWTRGGNIGVLVMNDSPYAGVIEYGRRPGARQPPREPIARFLQRKLSLPYEEARGMAFAVARSIGRRGLVARRVLTSDTTQRLLIECVQRNALEQLIAAVQKP